ncbi:MAG: hypothetical protein ACOY82_07320 [Pseudomonadota bacterium]
MIASPSGNGAASGRCGDAIREVSDAKAPIGRCGPMRATTPPGRGGPGATPDLDHDNAKSRGSRAAPIAGYHRDIAATSAQLPQDEAGT